MFGTTTGRLLSTKTEQDESTIRQNRMKAGVYLNPHIQKRDKGGEDAAALTQNVIAVADGVGGWAESGIDPAKFSRALCKNIAGLCLHDEDKYL